MLPWPFWVPREALVEIGLVLAVIGVAFGAGVVVGMALG